MAMAACVGTRDAGVDRARELLNLMDRRRRVFADDGLLFADPAWCLLLDLLVSGAGDARLPVSSCGIASRVPMSTALRYIALSVERGLVARHPNPRDRRSALLSLTPLGELLIRETLA